MLLSCRMLSDVADANHWRPVNQETVMQGDTTTLWFQLIDAAAHRADEGFNPPGRRYVPCPGASLQVTLKSLDSAKQVARYATQPFPTSDPSIWSLALRSTDSISGTVNIGLMLTEGAVVTRGAANAVLRIYSTSTVR